MSLNGVTEELSFTQREHEQAFLLAHRALRPDFIKTVSKGLRAFIFYRNFLSLLSFQKKKKPVLDTDIAGVPLPTLTIHKRKSTNNAI